MRRIRVFISDLPRMLGEIVTDIVNSQHDMKMVNAAASDSELPAGLEESGADVLVLCCGRAELRRRGNPLLASRPLLKIVALNAEGDASYVYGLEPVMVSLGKVSPESLVDAIRDAVGPQLQQNVKET